MYTKGLHITVLIKIRGHAAIGLDGDSLASVIPEGGKLAGGVPLVTNL